MKALAAQTLEREECWSQAIAVRNEGFVAEMKRQLGAVAIARHVISCNGASILREARSPYNCGSVEKNRVLSSKTGGRVEKIRA
jgi:hypothetical protein